jgi:hypothetical protein
MPAGTVLKETEVDLLTGDDIIVYCQVVGSVLYLANNTRPDIAYAVGQLARFMAKPAKIHYQHAHTLLRYLNGTRNLGIVYSNHLGERSSTYKVFTDATWGTEDDRKSVQGWAHMRYGGIVNWSSKRQRSTANSSMDAEIMAANSGAKEMAWMEKLRADIDPSDLNSSTPYVPTLYLDNQSGVDWCHNAKFQERSKHVEIQYYFIRNDMVNQKRLNVVHIEGKNQPADVLTKQLPREGFERHLKTLGMQRVEVF